MSQPLPSGWYSVSAEESVRLLDELRRELSAEHRLTGVRLEAIGRAGTNDDVLFRCLDAADTVVLVHLTWRGSAEMDCRWPSILFEGTFDELRVHASVGSETG